MIKFPIKRSCKFILNIIKFKYVFFIENIYLNSTDMGTNNQKFNFKDNILSSTSKTKKELA